MVQGGTYSSKMNPRRLTSSDWNTVRACDLRAGRRMPLNTTVQNSGLRGTGTSSAPRHHAMSHHTQTKHQYRFRFFTRS